MCIINKKIRIVEVGMAGIILFTLLFYYSFIIENAHHDCSGEDCSICVQLQVTVDIISNFKSIISNVPVFMAFFSVLMVACSIYERRNEIKETLITLKVELLN